MMRFGHKAFVTLLALGLTFTMGRTVAAQIAAPQVRLRTSLGDVVLQLDASRAPISVANFLTYVNSGFYDGTLFHRVLPGFVIQGGGFGSGLVPRATHAPIFNEAANGLSNTLGTIAMARTGVVHSATSQFFINTGNNLGLDHRDQSTLGFGYAVFGHVIDGLDAVLRIDQVPTQTFRGLQNVPIEEVVLLSARETTACAGDCDANRQVTMAEMLTMLAVNLGAASMAACIPGDADGNGTISVEEIVSATLQSCAPS